PWSTAFSNSATSASSTAGSIPTDSGVASGSVLQTGMSSVLRARAPRAERLLRGVRALLEPPVAQHHRGPLPVDVPHDALVQAEAAQLEQPVGERARDLGRDPEIAV